MFTPTVLVIGSIIIIVTIILIVVGIILLPKAQSGDVQLRLEEYASRNTPVTLEEIEMAQPFTERIIYPMLRKISDAASQLTPAQSRAKIKRNLELAGRPIKSPEIFSGIKVIAGVGMAIFAILILSIAKQPMPKIVLFGVISGAIGYVLPGVWLGSKIRKRQEEVIKSLPDALDLLVICVEAGLGFEGAMAKVSEKWDNELAKAFARVLQEIRLGKLRIDALREMDNNIGVPEITSFVAAIIQATQFGVSIAKVLRIQANQMRIQRRQRAEKKAQEAPIKMLFPMVFLIFPSLFIVLLGPAVLQIIDSGIMDAF